MNHDIPRTPSQQFAFPPCPLLHKVGHLRKLKMIIIKLKSIKSGQLFNDMPRLDEDGTSDALNLLSIASDCVTICKED
jgi:hypothetical protein